jgi:hypothetical protein
MRGSYRQELICAFNGVSSAWQGCTVSNLLSAVAGAQQLVTAGIQLMPARAASSGSKGRGRKYPSNVKGYDRLLSQWAHMTAKPGSDSNTKGKGQRPHGECASVRPAARAMDSLLPFRQTARLLACFYLQIACRPSCNTRP